jgi:anti-sigma factor ChrR (cupin superfamily)
MPPHLNLTDEVAESAALYALGVLSETECSATEQHLAEGCAICQSEINRCCDLLATWAQETEISAPPSLRQKLLRSIRSQKDDSGKDQPEVLLNRSGVKLLRPTRMNWNPGPSPGMWTKMLFNDTENDVSTLLLRMSAGSLYPTHRHRGVEEVYVLEGELQVEGMELVAGDFCVSQPESVHQSAYSKSGCVLMVKTSKHDEVLR